MNVRGCRACELAQLLINLGGERAKALPVAGAARGPILDLLREVGQRVGAEDEAGALESVSVAARLVVVPRVDCHLERLQVGS